MKQKRCEMIYSETVAGTFTTEVRILLDTETGILYLYTGTGYGGGVTPLLDQNGAPARWEVSPPSAG